MIRPAATSILTLAMATSGAWGAVPGSRANEAAVRAAAERFAQSSTGTGGTMTAPDSQSGTSDGYSSQSSDSSSGTSETGDSTGQSAAGQAPTAAKPTAIPRSPSVMPTPLPRQPGTR